MAKVSIKFQNKSILKESVYEKTPCPDKEVVKLFLENLKNLIKTLPDLKEELEEETRDDKLPGVTNTDAIPAAAAKPKAKSLKGEFKGKGPDKISNIGSFISDMLLKHKELCKTNIGKAAIESLSVILRDENDPFKLTPYCRNEIVTQISQLETVKDICGEVATLATEPTTATQPAQAPAATQPAQAPAKKKPKSRRQRIKTSKRKPTPVKTVDTPVVVPKTAEEKAEEKEAEEKEAAKVNGFEAAVNFDQADNSEIFNAMTQQKEKSGTGEDNE